MNKGGRKIKVKILLIVHDVYQDDNQFPLGSAYLASVLRREGISVKIYNQDVFHYSNHHLANFLQSNHFDIIGLGFLAARFKETIESLCEVINKNKKNAWLVLGGHGPSPIPKYMLEKTDADVIAIGEAEETMVDLVKCKINNEDLADIRGIAYKDEGEVYINERRQPLSDLDSIPFPAWDLFPMEKYRDSMVFSGMDESEKSMAMITTRGCVARCSFCYRMEKGLRIRSMDNVIEEMKTLISKYDITYFMLLDELTFYNKNRVFEYEEALEKNGLKIKYSCNARAKFLDKEVAESLKKSGCQLVNIGFESLDQQVLDRMYKGITVEENIATAEVCNEVGLTMGLNVMWALPYDTKESLQKIVDFIKKYNTYGQKRTIRPVTPYPGSPLYYDAIEMGLLKSPDDFFNKFKNSDLITVNYTSIPTEECHKMLFAANTELILDHFLKTNGNIKNAKKLIDDYYQLYFQHNYKFRGARHYDRIVENE